MQFTLDQDDIITLSASTRAELAALFFKKPLTSDPANAAGFDFENVVSLTPEMVARFAERCSDKTLAGLRVIAEHGPVITANLLNKAGIENYSQFQSAVTRRTRTVSGDDEAFLFTWDDWTEGENGVRGYGHYAVTEKTFRSLRSFFNIQ